MSRTVLVLLGVVVLALAACGGDDGEPAAGANSSTTAEQMVDPEEEAQAEGIFIRRADRICKRGNQRIRELSGDPAAQLHVVGSGIEELRALEVPESFERQWRQYMTALELQYEADQRGNDREVRRQQQRKSDVALGIGLAVCGSG